MHSQFITTRDEELKNGVLAFHSGRKKKKTRGKKKTFGLCNQCRSSSHHIMLFLNGTKARLPKCMTTSTRTNTAVCFGDTGKHPSKLTRNNKTTKGHWQQKQEQHYKLHIWGRGKKRWTSEAGTLLTQFQREIVQPMNVSLPNKKEKKKKNMSERTVRREKNVANFGASSLRTARNKASHPTFKDALHTRAHR